MESLEEKVPCALVLAQDGSFRAFADKAPIFAEGKSLHELRRNLATAIRAYYGHEKPSVLLVGQRAKEP